MKRVRKGSGSEAAAAGPTEEASPPEPERAREETVRPQKTSLLRECWADLRGRDRPKPEPVLEKEKPAIPTMNGPYLSEEEMERLQKRYSYSQPTWGQ